MSQAAEDGVPSGAGFRSQAAMLGLNAMGRKRDKSCVQQGFYQMAQSQWDQGDGRQIC